MRPVKTLDTKDDSKRESDVIIFVVDLVFAKSLKDHYIGLGLFVLQRLFEPKRRYPWAVQEGGVGNSHELYVSLDYVAPTILHFSWQQ